MITGYYALPAKEGDRVSFTTRTLSGQGAFFRCWLGIAEVWDVRLDDGHVVHVHPELGETMERAT